MPGIAGLFAPTPSAAHEITVRQMIRTMVHSQASSSGTYFAPRLGVYAGWVAHENSFAARQSLNDRACGPVLLFAGECYPAVKLQNRYLADGDEFVRELNGLFSGLLIDFERQRALLFNDRFGSERLYFAENKGIVYFASEAKALLRVLSHVRAFDETGLAQYLAFGSTRNDHTLFRGIRRLPGGSLWIHVPGAGLDRTRYFTPAAWEQLPELDDASFESQLTETFARILPHYLQPGSPIGISLTGGLDTRMIMACLPHAAKPALAYTYAAEDADTLDVRIARRVAAARGIPHHVLRIGSAFLSDFAGHVDRTVLLTDGCAGATGAHEIYLSAQARELAGVRLTGNYGSEVLRSVSNLRPLHLAERMFDRDFVPLLRSAAHQVAVARSAHAVTRAVFEEVPWHLFGNLAAARSQLVFRTPYLDNEIVELAYRASTRQRQSAGPALRLIHDRDPALAAMATDRGLAWNRRSPGAVARRLFCEATFKLDYWHKEGLPDALRWVDHLGGMFSRFGLLGLHKFLPYRIWFRTELAPHLREVLTDSRIRDLQFLDGEALRSIVDEHTSGRRNRSPEINAALTLEAVDRVLLRAGPP